MAPIYRFIVEQKAAARNTGRKVTDDGGSKKGAAKKGKEISFANGSRGGVEHNRKMRAINPLLNRMTGGYWEKGVRLTRATVRLGNNIKENGVKGIFTGPAIVIIIAMVVTALMKYLELQQQQAQKMNAQNFKQLENGVGLINGQYKVSTNFWTGRHTYNQNK